MSKARRRRAQAGAATLEAREPLAVRAERLLARRAVIVTLVLILVGSLRIVLTYTVFNHTSDEPAHIACGMEWLDRGVYRWETQHPPLTRIMAALGPYLAGARPAGQTDMFAEGSATLEAGNQYDLRLALARAGNLPFFWLACWMVFLWSRRILGDAGAVIAVLAFTMTPTVLAHAALATTDMGVTACFAAAAYALVKLTVAPGPKTAAWLGLAGGLMVLSKFSALVYYPAAAALALGWWLYQARPTVREFWHLLARRLLWLGVAALAGFVIIWAGYRFSFGKSVWTSFPVPFPELYSGIKEVIAHNDRGHTAYFMGELRVGGWWAYFPTLLAVKLPVGLLALVAIGLWPRPQRTAGAWPLWIAVAIPAAILAVAMPARINIGVRHILPMFPFIAVIASSGAVWLVGQSEHSAWARWMMAGALFWLTIGSLFAHPDYLAYFNAFAGPEPERIVVDSDLDWGQDIKRLGRRLQELNAQSVGFTPAIMIDPGKHGFPLWRISALDAPYAGWNAVGVTEWKLHRMGLHMEEPNTKVWPDFVKPVERVGESILLYYIPPQPPNARRN